MSLDALISIYVAQLDLLDLLYKCARAQGKPDGPTAIPKSPFTAKLIALASSPKDNIDHSAELRALMVAFNRNLGKRAM